MFGSILADSSRLTQEQQLRYQACYCGLCRTLKTEYGSASRLVLSYDMTFLILLLSSLYEPEEVCGETRCIAHPRKKRPWFANRYTSYAAAMNAALFYHKCLDDWHDDRSLSRLMEAALLRRSAKNAERAYPRQCSVIRNCLNELSELENRNICDPDRTAAVFGKITASLFAAETDDLWTPYLSSFGDALGRFIYLSDALLDLKSDIKKGRFNPLRGHADAEKPESFFPILQVILGDAAVQMEHLPLVQDADLLKNILYSGVWLPHERKQKDCTKRKKRRDRLV